MSSQIRPNRLEVTDRFPMLGFTIRADRSPVRAEVAVATDPALFKPENKSKRTPSSFFSTRASGPIDVVRGEAVYLLPPEVLARFIGQDRLYVALATTSDRNGGTPHVDVLPGQGSPYVSIKDLTGRSLRRVRLVPSRQDRARGYNGNGATLEWAGDVATPGTAPAGNGSRAAQPNGGPATAPAADYDDGFGPLAGQAPTPSQTATPQLPAPPAPGGSATATAPSAPPQSPNTTPATRSTATTPAPATAKALDAPTLTLSGNRQAVTPPSVRRLASWEAAAVEAAVAVLGGPLGPVVATLPSAARAAGVSIGLGPSVGAGLGAGGGLGVGVIFGADGGIGVYGAAEFDNGFLASISATAQVTVVRGGIENFNGWGFAVAIAGGEEIYGGAAALFDTSGTFQGVSFQLGVGAGLTPVDFYVAVQRSASTQVAATQALGASRTKLATARSLALPPLRTTGDRHAIAPPEARTLPGWQAALLQGAIGAVNPALGTLIGSLPQLAQAHNVSIGIGPAVSAGLVVGGSIGTGVIFCANGDVGVYNLSEIDFGFLGSISATAQITVVNGGLDVFNGMSYAETVAGGEAFVAGVSALFDTSLNFIGASCQFGIGIGITPIDVYIGVQQSVATRVNAPQATAAALRARSSTPTAPAHARVLSTDIPLDPGNGGMSIGPDALEIGDIILSTTPAAVSDLIRFATTSDVSHAMLYVGQGQQVIDATGHGVRLRPLTDALADATVAVAFRYPGLTDDQKGIIADKAAELIGRSYNYLGIIRQAQFRVHRVLCDVLPDAEATACRTFFGKVDLGRGDSTEFFCSQLIVEAYQDAGVPLTDTPPVWSSPDDLAQLALRQGALAYVGHLKAPPYSSRQSIWAELGISAAAALSASARTPVRTRALTNESFTINWDEVESIPQPTDVSCWATAAAMVVGWRDLVSLSPETVAQICHRTTATGLDPAQVQQFANQIGLSYEQPQCFSVDGFRNLLENYGPLWVGAAVPTLHAIVVTGMYSDGTNVFVRVTDPWDRTVGTPGAPGPYLPTHTTGSRYILKWEDFVREYDEAPTDYSSVNLQILHASGVGQHIANRGPSTPAGYAQALRAKRAARQQPRAAAYARASAADAPAAAVTPADSAAAPTRRVDTGAAGSSRWSVEQYVGFRTLPGASPDTTAAPVERAIQLDDWPCVPTAFGEVKVPLTVAWRYSRGAVGDVSIRADHPTSAPGWTSSVSAQIADGPDSPTAAAVTVNVRYVFTQTGQPDIVANTQLTLFGDGTYNRQDRWVQQPAVAVA